jgi:diacylglycerol kinase (ATP)
LTKPGKILFVINPIAGGNDKSNLLNIISDTFNKTNTFYKYYYTSGKADEQNLLQVIKDFNPEIVVAVGGDGTCNLVAGCIINTEIKLAIIPVGSANGLATELNIPKEERAAIELIFQGFSKKIDTIKINNKNCLHISDIGLNAKCIKRFEKEKIRGLYGYAKQFFRELWYSKPSKYTFMHNDGKFKKKAHVVAIANATKYGTGALINPNGKIDDGKFEICIVKPYPFWSLISIASAIFLGYLDKIKYAEIRSFEKIRIIKKKKITIHVDGEILPDTDVIDAEINKASLNVLVPKT